MNVKQVIIIRTSYPDGKGGVKKIRTGKLIAQGAHASMKAILDEMKSSSNYEGVVSLHLEMQENTPMSEWIFGLFAKIVVYVNSEEELEDIYRKAIEMNIPRALIVDSGRTEFHGVPTKTAVAIGPWYSEELDKITGHLKLL